MKLHEIAPFPNRERSEEDYYDYLARLCDLKMKQIGSGLQSSVYKHPQYDTMVVKVAREGRTGGPLEFLKYATEHQNNPHVPKIYDIRRYGGKVGFTTYYIVFLEKLDRHLQDLPDQKQMETMRKYFGPIIDEQNMDDAEFAWEQLLLPKNLALLREQSTKLGVPSEPLLDLMTFIANTKKARRGDLDLHNKNIMMRGNVPVIIDPFV